MSRTQMIGMKVGGGGRWVATRVMVLALVVGLVVFGHASVTRAAPKGLDPSFGSQDIADEVAVQDDGRIVAVGTSASDFALARYNPDGSPNASFSNDGRRIPTSEATTTRHGAS
jgi:hypothetical protein